MQLISGDYFATCQQPATILGTSSNAFRLKSEVKKIDFIQPHDEFLKRMGRLACPEIFLMLSRVVLAQATTLEQIFMVMLLGFINHGFASSIKQFMTTNSFFSCN